MASNTRQTRIIRKRKRRPNKTNRKADMKRILRNLEILARVAEAE